jgi:uncharacterized membrane protein YedE/YeeE
MIRIIWADVREAVIWTTIVISIIVGFTSFLALVNHYHSFLFHAIGIVVPVFALTLLAFIILVQVTTYLRSVWKQTTKPDTRK